MDHCGPGCVGGAWHSVYGQGLCPNTHSDPDFTGNPSGYSHGQRHRYPYSNTRAQPNYNPSAAVRQQLLQPDSVFN
jgi:hypothetical protein